MHHVPAGKHFSWFVMFTPHNTAQQLGMLCQTVSAVLAGSCSYGVTMMHHMLQPQQQLHVHLQCAALLNVERFAQDILDESLAICPEGYSSQ